MEISLVFQEHPDDDIWEEYALGRVSTSQEEKLEQHLLLCEHCQRVLAGNDEYVRAMKFATAHFPAARLHDQPPQRRKIIPFLPPLPAGFPSCCATSTVASACLVLLVVLGTGRALRTFAANPVTVPLQSLRAGAEAMNQALARHPLDLTVPLSDVPASAHSYGQYRFEVVTARGAAVWSGPAESHSGAIGARIPNRLDAGLYWVRLYGAPGELLVEYGLKLN